MVAHRAPTQHLPNKGAPRYGHRCPRWHLQGRNQTDRLSSPQRKEPTMGAVKNMIPIIRYLHQIFNSGMSKRFYVLYTLKEFYLPRIYKTKATVNKYIEENNKLEFKLFAKEEEAQLFSKSIEVKLEKKFKIKMVEYLQKSHREIEEINEKSAGEAAASGNGQEGEGKKELERRVEEEGKKEKRSEKTQQQQQQKIQVAEAKTVQKSETNKEITKTPEQIIENSPPQMLATKSPVQVEQKQQENQQTVVEQKREVIEQIKAEVKQQIAGVSEQARGEVKQQATAQEQQREEIVKQETPAQIVHQPQVNEQTKQQDKLQVKQQVQSEVIEQFKVQKTDQAKLQVKEQPKQQVKEQVQEQVKEQTKQIARQEVKEQTRQQLKEQVKESAKEQVQEQLKEQVVIIAKEPQTIIQTIIPNPLKQQTPSISLAIATSQHIPNIHLHHLFYPLSPKYLFFLYPKVIKYYNFPSICNLLRFHHLQTTNIPTLQLNTALTLNISLIFKQNPGLSIVILDIQSPSLPKEINYLKTVVLGVKGKEQAKVLALLQGLKYASTFGKSSSLTINSNFPPLKNQQKSLDARVRHLFSQYLTQQQSFSRVCYV